MLSYKKDFKNVHKLLESRMDFPNFTIILIKSIKHRAISYVCLLVCLSILHIYCTFGSVNRDFASVYLAQALH